MTIQDITCFIKLAETLSYTKTAEALYISQPAVTKHIKILENEIGAPLFDRSIRRAITLTEIGSLLYQGLKQCENIYNETMQNIQLHTNQSTLFLNMLRGTTIPDNFVRATSAFMTENPDFRHLANFIEYSDFTSVLDRGEIIFCARDLIPSGKNYANLKLTQEPVPYYIYASENHRAFASKDHIELSEIADSSLFLANSMPKQERDMLMETLIKLFGRPPKETMFLDSMDSVALFLRSSECFTIGTGWNVMSTRSGLHRIPLPLFTDFYAVWNLYKQKNPFVQPYLQALIHSHA
ncbi:MAG: LysR family transcriptional regulator [Eubacteriales bacterium]|nr:LysR family transcriptional regulator [Eubacteriales bacterium]